MTIDNDATVDPDVVEPTDIDAARRDGGSMRSAGPETPTSAADATHDPGTPADPGGHTFEDFCRREHASIANALGWALGGHDLGTEAADEAFARAYERWSDVSEMANPTGWVYRVGLNWGRRRIWRRRKERELISTFDLDHHTDAYLDHDLARALQSLPVKFRAVVVLRYLLGYSERATAESLGISTGTAKSRMSRALVRLRNQLDLPEPPPPSEES